MSDAREAAAMARRLETLYSQTGPAIRAAGREWYPAAEAAARAMAAAHDSDPRTAAAVIAALSPRAQWAVNLAWSARVLDAAAAGSQSAPAVSFGANRAKAFRIATGADPDAILGGDKVRSFFANITGDSDAVTLDVWAARAATGKRENPQPAGRRYRVMADAYRRAARKAGESPRDLQAILWMHIRGVKPSDPETFRPAEPLALEA